MKTSKLYILLLSTLAFASCTKEMTEGLDEVNVSVVTSETVTAEGSIITVKKGTPVEFSFAGEPDFITFYSGELGHQYIYRQRVENEESDIVSSKLKFNIYKVLHTQSQQGVILIVLMSFMLFPIRKMG